MVLSKGFSSLAALPAAVRGREEHQPTILFVDDEQEIVASLADLFRRNYHVVTATSADEALVLLKQHNVSVIVADQRMPGKTGSEFLAEACMIDSDIVRILLTGYADIEAVIQAVNNGKIFFYLTKPWRSNELEAIIGKAVEHHLLLKDKRKLVEELRHMNADLEERVKDRTRELEDERTLAHNVLENIMLQRIELQEFTTAVIFRPSDKIGGDFFDAWTNGSYTHFLIGDISGHSTSAALMMAVSKGIFRTLGNTMTDPVEIVKAANRMLFPMMFASRMFLTLVYVLFDHNDNTVCVVSAGHNPTYLLNGSDITTIDSTGAVIGWDREDCWEAVRYHFEQGMILFLYTDGLVEATDASGVEFGERFPSVLGGFPSPQALADGIFAQAEKFSEGVFRDDVTIFAIGRDLP